MEKRKTSVRIDATKSIVSRLIRDETCYRDRLQFEKDGSKSNPIQLDGLQHIDAEITGNYIRQLHVKWKPAEDTTEQKIGTLYGFDLFIRQQAISFMEQDLWQTRYKNHFYAQHPDGGIKYTYNQGQPAEDNAKLPARHFLNALDRIPKLKEHHAKELTQFENDIGVLQKLMVKPFDKDEELKSLKQELSKLEREMALKIEANKMKQQEVPVVKMEETKPKKSKGMRM